MSSRHDVEWVKGILQDYAGAFGLYYDEDDEIRHGTRKIRLELLSERQDHLIVVAYYHDEARGRASWQIDVMVDNGRRVYERSTNPRELHGAAATGVPLHFAAGVRLEAFATHTYWPELAPSPPTATTRRSALVPSLKTWTLPR